MKDKTKTRLKVAGAFVLGAGAMFVVYAKTKTNLDKTKADFDEFKFTQNWIDEANFGLIDKMSAEVASPRADEIRGQHFREVFDDYKRRGMTIPIYGHGIDGNYGTLDEIASTIPTTI